MSAIKMDRAIKWDQVVINGILYGELKVPMSTRFHEDVYSILQAKSFKVLGLVKDLQLMTWMAEKQTAQVTEL